jgi:hypothetical protein
VTRRFLTAALLGVCACAQPEALTRVTQATPDGTCTTGGVVIATGRDTNGNGKLDDSEVKEQSTVCSGGSSNGTGGKTTLVNTTDLPVGDATCAQGGVRFDVGLDDGAGGGTANNGKLEPGEITSTRHVCNGGVPYYPGSITAPGAPAGTFRLDSTGGAGAGANGAAAGAIAVRIRSGTLGGHTRVFKTGVTDAAFTLPMSGSFAPGPVTLPVTANTTLNTFGAVGDGLSSGDAFFLVNNDVTLYRNMGGQAVAATSITVNQGATLTFSNNFGNDARVRVRNDIRSAGNLTTALLGDNLTRGSLVLEMGTYWGEAGSNIYLRGEDDANMAGGGGGALTLGASAKVVNAGGIVTSGGNGTDGANGGAVNLSAATGEVLNSGNIETRGGTGSVGNGGSGGAVTMRAAWRGVKNSGSIDTSGNMGGPNGGNGGQISLAPSQFGPLYNGGALTTRGGPCADVDCNGGSAGQVLLDSFGGELRNAAPITATGGDGRGQGNGGNGALVHLYSRDVAGSGGTVSLAAGELQLSGNIVTRGGAGNAGGAGGPIDVVLDATNVPQGQQLTLLGYQELIANGGASAAAAGGGGGGIVVSNAVSLYLNSVFGPGGAALNFANVLARGGNGNPGGPGGTFTLSSQLSFNFNNTSEYASNGATTLDLRGGDGDNGESGGGGTVVVRGAYSASNASAVNVSGGEVTAGGAASGGGGTVVLRGDYGAASNSGAITANGGLSLGNARGGGTVVLMGGPVTNTGAITCNGGSATNVAGPGGNISLLSTSGATTSSGTLSVAAGDGGTANVRGTITVDGVDVTP